MLERALYIYKMYNIFNDQFQISLFRDLRLLKYNINLFYFFSVLRPCGVRKIGGLEIRRSSFRHQPWRPALCNNWQFVESLILKPINWIASWSCSCSCIWRLKFENVNAYLASTCLMECSLGAGALATIGKTQNPERRTQHSEPRTIGRWN